MPAIMGKVAGETSEVQAIAQIEQEKLDKIE